MFSVPEGSVLPPDHPASITVKSIGERLCRDIPKDLIPAENIPSSFTFTVVKNDTPNAFALPPNHCVVFTGLFKFARTEDELAAIIAHEISHVICRHSGEKLTDFGLGSVMGASIDLFLGGGFGGLIGAARRIGWDLPNSRTMETEADFVGIHLLNAACFDVAKAPEVFKRMENEMSSEGGSLPSFMSTHPTYDDRVKKLEKWGKEVKVGMNVGEDKCDSIREDWRAVMDDRIRRLEERRRRVVEKML